MPLSPEKIQEVQTFLDNAFANYSTNLQLYKAASDPELRLRIQHEIKQKTLWKSISAAILSYAEAAFNEKELLDSLVLDTERLTKYYKDKEIAIAKFADAMTTMIGQFQIPFTDPTKAYYFWGTDAGEHQAYLKSKCGQEANVIAAASAPIFQILLGPMSFVGVDPKTVDYQFYPEEKGKPQYALLDILYPQATRPHNKHLPDCSRMLWAAMSKVYADKTVKTVSEADPQNPPPICVFLPEQVDRDSNFWLWELPAIRALASQGKTTISYQRLDPQTQQWIDANFEDYAIARREAMKNPAVLGENPQKTVEGAKLKAGEELEHEGKTYYRQPGSISVKQVQRTFQQWKKHTDNKDRQRPLSVMFNVLQHKSTLEKDTASYHAAGLLNKKEASELQAVSAFLGSVWDPLKQYAGKTAAVRNQLLQLYYSVEKVDISYTEQWSLANRQNWLGHCFKKETLNPSKLPKTLSGQLKLMQIAKLYHQYQLIIDLYEHELKSLRKSVQAREFLLWALNRRAEIMIQSLPQLDQANQKEVRSSAASNLKSAEIFEKNLLAECIKAGRPLNEAVLFEQGRRIGLALQFEQKESDPGSVQTFLNVYKNNLIQHKDPASGAKYLQEVARFGTKFPADVNEIRYVAERTYNTVLLCGIEECVEPAVLRAALLAAITLNDIDKINTVKKRMKEIPILWNEVNYIATMSCYQLVGADQVKSIKLVDNPHFIEISKSQQSKEFEQLEAANKKSTNPVDRFHQSSYDYRQALTTYFGGIQRGGNMAYGGALPQQLINNSDIAIFTKLLDEPISNIVPSEEALQNAIDRTPDSNLVAKNFFIRAKAALYGPGGLALSHKALNSITNPSTVLNAMRLIVALNFQSVADACDPNKAGYRQLDYAVNAMNRLMTDSTARKDRHYDSTTSLSIMFGIQVGDCRHHAESMQLLFDTWKYKKLSTALDKNEMGDFNSLCNTQLRIIDSVQQGDVLYAHTFNILEQKMDNHVHHIVYDAFDLEQEPQPLNLRLDPHNVIEFTTQKLSNLGTDVVYKAAPYAGDKGTAKVTGEELIFLGRAGIEESSVYQTIVDRAIREKMQRCVNELASAEQIRTRKTISVQALFEMVIIKGYVFDDEITSTFDPSNDTHLVTLMSDYLKHIKYTRKHTDEEDRRLLIFLSELKHNSTLVDQIKHELAPTPAQKAPEAKVPANTPKLSNAKVKPETAAAYNQLLKNLKTKYSGVNENLKPALAILDDYTKGDSRIKRALHFHWNRHHTSKIAHIVKEIRAGKITTIEDLLTQLAPIVKQPDFNTQGSLARRIRFIEEYYGGKASPGVNPLPGSSK